MSLDQKTLGQLIEALSLANPTDQVLIGWNDLIPTFFRSYRGDYSQLALDFETANDGYVAPTVAAFLDLCKKLLGSKIEGYKGGSYRVDGDTRIYISRWGRVSDVELTGFLQAAGVFYLESAVARD